jgi:hypothetical protein
MARRPTFPDFFARSKQSLSASRHQDATIEILPSTLGWPDQIKMHQSKRGTVGGRRAIFPVSRYRSIGRILYRLPTVNDVSI